MEGTQKTIQLIQKSNTYNYKIVIPVEVEKKIRYVCQKIWDTEWSGILFYTPEGSFEENNLVIRCQDIYIMDIGTQTYTEFDMSPDVIAFMTDNDLLDCQIALIHSHNHMNSFFSQTDINTLKEEGSNRNNFVSLIVNNAGNYTAAITRKVFQKKIIESSYYEFFDQGKKHHIEEIIPENEIVEWFYLKVEKENNDNEIPELNLRLEEIKNNKSKSKIQNVQVFNKQPSLFDDIESYEEDYEEDFYMNLKFNPTTIKNLTVQLLTGSILVQNTEKFDLKKWVTSMPTLYTNRFGEGQKGMITFNAWADTFTDFLICNSVDNNLKNQGVDPTEMAAMCAEGVLVELTKLPQNVYIKKFIEILNAYILFD